MCYTIKSVTSPEGNRLKFRTFNTLYPEGKHMVVSDLDCQMERVYIIGQEQKLGQDFDNDQMTMITSKQQVIDSWCSGDTWF